MKIGILVRVFEQVFEKVGTVVFTCDGVVMIYDDSTIEEEMGRIKQLFTDGREQNDNLPYAGWMRTRHMSALETSTREEILAAITLSEEDERMTIFTNGTFEDYPGKELVEG